jgi:hypothetical protein
MQVAAQDLLAVMAEDGARLQLLKHGADIASLAHELARRKAETSVSGAAKMLASQEWI